MKNKESINVSTHKRIAIAATAISLLVVVANGVRLVVSVWGGL